ncbi:hypothetical protein [Paenibacillus sp. sgz500992]|uniref:hypothetical protein n=1 Tax=Paenibacillus sp. sgz500992 TaxID=3242476 RepID=UPI0036D26840
MTNPIKHESDQLNMDEAWARLQDSIAQEPVNPVWAAWGQQSTTNNDPLINAASTAGTPGGRTAMTQITGQADSATEGKKTGKRPRRPQMNRRRKWAATAASVAIFAAILATPVGSTAMAAILNQFRMQEPTVVNESDLRNIFNQISEGGTVGEAASKFGAVSSSSGTIDGAVPINDLQKTLGYSAVSGEGFDQVKSAWISSSQEMTLTLNVDAVNEALLRLGSDQLLPESIDGKPITLAIPEIVRYDLSTDNEHWASFTQMNTPIVTVDPSIDVEEAVKAVLDFPLLPDHLKSSLQQSRILSGDIPLPLIKGQFSEEITIDGTPVIFNKNEYGRGTQYSATWVKNGQLFDFSGGEVYSDKDEFMTKLQELITS